MRKEYILVGAAFVLLVAILLSASYSSSFIRRQNFLFSSLPPAPSSTDARGSALTIQSKAINENSDRFIVGITYPEISGLSDTAAEARINGALKDYVGNARSAFESQALQDEKEIKNPKLLAIKNEFYITYKTELLTPALISIRFTRSENTIRETHPTNYVQTFNYDIRERKILALKDLFKPNVPYLQILSEYAKDDLAVQLEGMGLNPGEWLNGADPTEENYANFVVTDKALIILFDTYQVAPYSAGIREVKIPYEKIKDNINLNIPLSFST